MIQIASGNIFDDNARAIVVPVNTTGVMGKGLALQAARTFPALLPTYRRALETGHLGIGKVFTVHFNVNLILFPTKDHWRNPSQLDYVQSGLGSLSEELRLLETPTAAIPALGCGLGGLDWNTVRPMIETMLGDLPMLIRLYTPREGG
jgi:O-acetyl-ADP-ribose deacetylase (regulator of RNase III)